MELRQLRYFAAVIEHGSMGRAALELGVVTSALSQQISRLESELSTRLLRRTANGVVPTDAGLAFWRQAQLALRHVDHAAQFAREARLSGHVSVGLPPSTASVMGVPFMQAMKVRYPDIRLRIVESLSGYLGTMLGARQIDLAVIFQSDPAQRWSVLPMLDERLFVIGSDAIAGMPEGDRVSMKALGALPLLLPSETHGLRALVARAFEHAKLTPNVVGEIDGLALLMASVQAGIGATIQPGAALAANWADGLSGVAIVDKLAQRPNLLASLPDDELAPAALAARVVMLDVASELVSSGRWPGARLTPRENGRAVS
jgi:LysR family transcriptional regulator, regulatory protein for tcuABC